MRRVIALVLTLAILLSTGLLDATVWAVELTMERSGEAGEAEKPASSDNIVSIPVVDFGGIVESNQPQSTGEDVVDNKTQVVYREIDDDACEIVGYYGREAELLIPASLGGMAVVSVADSAFAFNEYLRYVELPDGVESIGSYAFENCPLLETVVLPNSVEFIGYYAFGNCEVLRQINYPMDLSDTGGNLFANCYSLERIDVPGGVEELPDHIFAGCNTLKEVNLPSTLEIISEGAFEYCSALEAIILPETVNEIHAYAFNGCTSLEEIVLPSGVEYIGHRAFGDCINLSSVNYPDALEEVGGYLFEGCTELDYFEVPEGVKELPDHILAGCNTLQEVNLPSTLEIVSEGAFEYCSALEAIDLPETVNEIHAYAFNGCTSLEEIVLPSGVEYIGHRAFGDCVNLSSVNYPDALEEVGGYLFEGCTELDYFEMPEGVKELPDHILAGCNTLQEVKLPSTLEIISEGAFEYCEALEKISLPEGLEEIHPYAFNGCIALEEIEIPEGIEELPSNAFSGCVELDCVTLPHSLARIGDCAFEYCKALEEIVLPDSVEYLGYRAFGDCTELASVNYPAALEEIGGNIFAGCSELTSFEIPEGVVELPAYILAGCNTLTEIRLPSTLEIIGEGAFEYCTELESIELPGSLEEIQGYAFGHCIALQEIVIPAGIEVLPNNIFSGCAELISVTLPDSLLRIEDCAFEYCEELEEIALPDSVEFIGSYAFGNCRELSVINYPASLEEIGGNIFAGCKDLTDYEIPEGVTKLPAYIFSGCDTLEEIRLPSTLTEIGESAFACCTDLETIVLPDGLQTIGNSAFSNCTALEKIELPDGITTLPEYAFYGCSDLRSVTLPESLTEIQACAFENCTELEGIVLPDGLQTIGDSAFSGCEELAAIWLPEGLAYIGWYAFHNCKDLEEITIPLSVTEIGDEAFGGIRDLILYCDVHSAAAVYAIEHGIPMVAINGEDVSNLYEMDTAKSSYEINYDGLSASGNLSMVVRYAFKDASRADPVQLIISIPESVELVESTLLLNGKLCTEYEFDEWERLLYVPVEEKNGDLRFSLKPVSYDKISTYAKMEFYSLTGEWRTEVVGTVYTELPILNLSARNETSETTVDISGVTISRNTVDLYINGEKADTVTANRAGNYRATLELPDRSNNKRYTIRAETRDADGNLITAETVVTYKEGTPTLTQFIMEHDGQEFRMEDIMGMKPVVTFNPAADFRFTVKFDMVSSIERVFIVSTRNNVTKLMEAVWSESEQAYIAQGWFDPADHNYVPGTISVEYVRAGDEISFDAGIDFTSDEIVNQVPEEWKDADVTVHEATDNKTDVTITLQDGSAGIHVVTEEKPIPSGLNPGNAQSHGYTPVIDSTGRTVYIRSEENADGLLMEILDWTDNVWVSQTIETIVDPIPGVSEAITAVEFVSTFMDGAINAIDMQMMRQEIIYASHLSAAQKEAALNRLDEAARINAQMTMIRLTGVVLGTVVTGAATAAFGPVGGFLCGVAVKYIDDIMADMHDQYMSNVRSSICQMLFGWAIDPSGYVYDAVTEARLPGVTVTAYWIPYDDAVDDFWGTVPEENEYGYFWDASEYSQANSLISDAEGRYAWDVPEGWWRVKCEMDGYETTWSEWLPVPPPQTEVYIGMTPLENDVNVVYGDVNGDGRINTLDLIILRQYLAGWDVELDIVAADVNGNDTVNTLDLIILRQYLAGWDVTLGPKS